MMPSRKERHAAKPGKAQRAWRGFAAAAFISLCLLAGIYYIWDNNWNVDRASHPADGRIDPDGLPAEDGEDQADTGQKGAGDGSEEQGAESVETIGPETVRFALVGDIMLSGRYGEIVERQGYDYPYLHVRDILMSADVAAGNLETAVTNRGEAHANKQYTYRSAPETVPDMKAAGFDVFNLANNHTIDFGTIGLLDTFDYLDEAGIGRIGAGLNEEEAYAPWTTKIGSTSVCFLGFTRVLPTTAWRAGSDKPGLAETYDASKAVRAIEAARPDCGLLVVMVHWGLERVDFPEPYMVDNAHRYIDAGADLVVGSHPHVLQGLEQYNGKWIAYSLGNFIFPGTANAADRDSAILLAECGKDGDCALQVVPVKTGYAQPYLAEGEEAEAILERLRRISFGIEVHADGRVTAVQ